MTPFDPERLIKVLGKHRVKYVLIGALAARLHGFPRLTADADITPSTDLENLKRLADALNEIDARFFTENIPEGLPFDCSAASLQQADVWNFITTAGRLDVAFTPAGTTGYEDLQPNSVRFKAYGVELLAASVEDIIRSKKAADRPQDRQDIIILNEILKRKQSD